METVEGLAVVSFGGGKEPEDRLEGHHGGAPGSPQGRGPGLAEVRAARLERAVAAGGRPE
ncbi:hypothetical protein [Streptomyces sp. NPDC058861]|uniref:hypothetical protein n=1 Tax=Streptomyces sp. NPDC058861 TaxID=3346653 RepID=UPI0036ADA2C7